MERALVEQLASLRASRRGHSFSSDDSGNSSFTWILLDESYFLNFLLNIHENKKLFMIFHKRAFQGYLKENSMISRGGIQKVMPQVRDLKLQILFGDQSRTS
jgi:hypothetical protein